MSLHEFNIILDYRSILVPQNTVKINVMITSYMVVISVAKSSDGHYITPQISLPCSDVHYSFLTVIYNIIHP